MTLSDDFLVYGILNIGIEVFKDLIRLKDENKFNEMIEKAKRNGEDVSNKEIKESIERVKNQLNGYDIQDIESDL